MWYFQILELVKYRKYITHTTHYYTRSKQIENEHTTMVETCFFKQEKKS